MSAFDRSVGVLLDALDGDDVRLQLAGHSNGPVQRLRDLKMLPKRWAPIHMWNLDSTVTASLTTTNAIGV